MLKERVKTLDPITFAVLASKFDEIVREMAQVMLMSARNVILHTARDFSCSIQTGDCRIVSQVDVLPVHTVTGELATKPILEFFAGDIQPGDAFLNNSPYHGNAHCGDFTMAVPVFYQGELTFWTVARAHQLDVGAYIPSSHNPNAKDVYEEGIHFPCVRLQRNYKDVADVIRIFKENIRYPQLWYGDFLAQVGSLRVGENRLTQLCDKYGADFIKQFVEAYIDYADRRMGEQVRKLPRGTWKAETRSDPYVFAPEGTRVVVKMTIDPEAAMITFDTTESDDQVEGGINTCESSAKAGVIEGALTSLDPTVPRNHGCLRHFNVILREGCVAGIPRWPASTSATTTFTADRLANVVYKLFTQAVPELGHADCGYICGTLAFVTGKDFRRNGQPYTALPFLAESGGPASMGYDGWPNFLSPAVCGAQMMESVEVHEEKFPHLIMVRDIEPDSGGAGQWRGGLGVRQQMKPRKTDLLLITIGDGHVSPPQGVLGGKPGSAGDHWIKDSATGKTVQRLANSVTATCKAEQEWEGVSNGGGGFGDPLERDPELVRHDARNGYITLRSAREDYGVVLNTEPELYEVDFEATKKLRQKPRRKGGAR